MKLKTKRLKLSLTLFFIFLFLDIVFFITRDKISYIEYTNYSQLYGNNNSWSNELNISLFKSKSEKDLAYKISQAEAGINPGDTDLEKLNKLGRWLIRILSKCPVGKPADSVNSLPALNQLTAFKEKKSPAWCGNYGHLFLFFANANHIKTRMIEIINPGNHHIINESFLTGKNKWITVDLTNKIIYSTSNNGTFLNTIDLISAIQKNERFVVNTILEDRMVSNSITGYAMPWRSLLIKNPDIYFYKHTVSNHIYSLKEKIRRYTLPRSYYEVFTVAPKTNIGFYARSLCIWVTFIVFILICYHFIRPR